MILRFTVLSFDIAASFYKDAFFFFIHIKLTINGLVVVLK